MLMTMALTSSAVPPIVSLLLCMLTGHALSMTPSHNTPGVQFHDYCIVGAGPSGLQLGYYMKAAGRDYIIYERNNVSGSFFVKYPRHRKLISINKVVTGKNNHYFNERHDWNSLISDDDSLLFKEYSKEFFPWTEPMLEYLRDYQQKLEINVQFNTEVQNLRRVKPGERTDGYNFVMNDQRGNFMLCKVAVLASGMGKPNMIKFPGSEYVEQYSDFDVDRMKYVGKTVLILGRGNSAFETADEIYPVANTVHMVSRNRVRLSWNTHYVGDLRGLNNNILDTYQLKSLDGLLEFDVKRMGLVKRNGKLYASVHWGDEYNDTSLYPRVKPENEDNFANFPFRLPYDHVISCLGWRFDGSLLHTDTQQIPHGKVGKYPAIRYDYQSWVTRDLYFAGTNSHSLDWRKSAGGFIHGFRYTARALHRVLEYRYHGVPWFSHTHDMTQLLNVVLKRINEAPGTYQMYSFLGDVVVFKGDHFVLVEEFPIKLLPHFSEVSGHSGSKYLVIINEYGPGFSAPDVDTLGPDRASTGGAMEAHKSNFLHPVMYFYDGWLPTESQISELPTETWKFALPRPDKVHHVVEDFLSVWTASTVHILPLRRFLDDVVGEDLRLYLNIHCFELGLNFANVPAGCKPYLEGRGLSLSVGETADTVNYMHGTTKWRAAGTSSSSAQCDQEEFPQSHNSLNRTEILERRLKHFYPSDNFSTLFPHDYASDDEEVEGFRFIYEDTVPEALLEDDEVRSIWRWSRSTIAHQNVEYPSTTLTESNFDSVVKTSTHGIIVYGLNFDPVTRSAEEMLNALVADFAQMAMTSGMAPKKPLLARVNCYDWPRLCEKQMIMEYPTIKVLHKGMLKPYRGPIEKEALMTAVKLSAMDFPVMLDSVKDVTKFLSEENLINLGVDSAVVLSYPELYSAHHSEFDFLDDHFGKTPVAICCNSSSSHEDFYKKYGSNLGLMHARKDPWAVVSHVSDTYLPFTTRSFVLPPQKSVSAFLDDAILPIFGELNWKTLPNYYKAGNDLLMLFGTESQRVISGRVMADLAIRSRDRGLKFVWVNSDTPGVYVYTKYGGHVVALNQRENLAYWYTGDTHSVADLAKWIVDYKKGRLEAAADRPRVDWPPAGKSYDFLSLIEAEEMAKVKQENLAKQVLKMTKSHSLLSTLEVDIETTIAEVMDETMAAMKKKNATAGGSTMEGGSQSISGAGKYAAEVNQRDGAAVESKRLLDQDVCLNGECDAQGVSYGTYSHAQHPSF